MVRRVHQRSCGPGLQRESVRAEARGDSRSLVRHHPGAAFGRSQDSSCAVRARRRQEPRNCQGNPDDRIALAGRPGPQERWCTLVRTALAIFFLALAATAVAAAGEPTAAGDGPMPVFVLAGQSNMVGAGQVAELPAEFKGPFRDALFTRFWGTEFKPLDPAKLGKTFGPEVTFGLEMAKALKRPVGMIKLSSGGTSLEQHWNPVTFDKEKHVGELYKRLTDYVTGIQAKQKNVKVLGMIWMQGEADAKYHSKTVEQYRDKLEALIDGCRKEFGNPDLPFVCGRMNASGQYEKQVREAQETVKRKNYAWIDCDGLEKNSDKLHYSTKGQLELGREFAKAMLKLMNEAPKPDSVAEGDRRR